MEEQKIDTDDINIPEILPMLPVRDIVIFPYMILPLFVGRDMSIKAVEEALSKDRLVFLATQKDFTEEEPRPEGIYKVGTVAMIMRMLKLPDGRVKILIQGVAKASIVEYISDKQHYVVRIEKIKDIPSVQNLEGEALLREVKDKIAKLLPLKNLPPEISMITDSINDPGRLADLVASNLRLKVEESQLILEIVDQVERLRKINDFLQKEIEVSSMQQKIQSQAKEEIGKTQREYFLREQLKAIKQELGEGDEKAEEINELREKILQAKMPEDVQKEALKQLKRLEMMHPDSAESSITRTYLEWMVELPWSKSTEDNIDIKKARQVLDDDHYDLEKVKERILEYLSVRKLKDKMKGPILCFVGPPGVGKTSLGRSIARALGRQFVRISLGGMRDEAEIRGHRRTYVGALPGRIIQGMKQAGVNNPVFMLDEIDKIGMDFRGDPSSALLEVLDPEQNNSFSDHYLNVAFDLSNVMFICTANLLDPVPSALKDRMEVINLPGYTDEEKLRIAKKYLIPRQIDENGIKKDDLKLSDESVLTIINSYTKEAGLRNLEREIAGICRKIAKFKAEKNGKPKKITPSNVNKYLGAPKFLPEEELQKSEVGVSTGLAWTPYGGEVLFIEVQTNSGKGTLTLTGSLGDVMKESAQAALTYARTKTSELKIDEKFYEKTDIHVHVPAGAIPKDGPSAGVTIATALISALSKIPVKRSVAMTGEITLRGNVLPIGGLKEKSLAALRAKITDVIIPKKNMKDIEELPKYIKRKMSFIPVDKMDQILDVALEKGKIKKNKK